MANFGCGGCFLVTKNQTKCFTSDRVGRTSPSGHLCQVLWPTELTETE